MWLQKVAIGSRGGEDKHWAFLCRKSTTGPRNPKLKIAGDCYEKHHVHLPCSYSFAQPAALWTCCGRQRWEMDPRYESCDHLHTIKPIHIQSTTLKTLFLLWRCLPGLPLGLRILQLIGALLTHKPETCRRNVRKQRATVSQAICPRTICLPHPVL